MYFKLSGDFSIHVALCEDTMSCEQSEWELEYDDGPSTFSYSCISSGSVSDSNHSTDVPSLLSCLNNILIFALLNILFALFNIFNNCIHCKCLRIEIFLEHNLRIIAEKCKNSSNKIR